MENVLLKKTANRQTALHKRQAPVTAANKQIIFFIFIYFNQKLYNFQTSYFYIMNSIEKLKQEHEEIERELSELELIMQDEIINYSNLLHTLKNLVEYWDKHEQREERIFPILKHEKIIIPVKTMLFDHKILRVHKDAIKNAINSKSELKVKDALNTHGKIIIEKLRKHINDEDEILYRITFEIFTPKELDELEVYEE